MNEKEAHGGMTAMYMDMDTILQRLQGIKDASVKLSEDEHSGAVWQKAVWQKDADALEVVISMMIALQNEGINDAATLKDLLYDYNAQAKQCREMHRKYETPIRAVRRDGVWHCPECNHRVQMKHSFCHWCGKKLEGW